MKLNTFMSILKLPTNSIGYGFERNLAKYNSMDYSILSKCIKINQYPVPSMSARKTLEITPGLEKQK